MKTNHRFVQEPETLLTAPIQPKKNDGTMFLLQKLRTSLRFGDNDLSTVNEEDSIAGVLIVFTDYEKALAAADGDPSSIAFIRKAT